MSARAGLPRDDLDRALEAALGWTFIDRAVLDKALTHRSFCAEQGIPESNERLEFLGDSVLGFVVTAFVYDEYPALPEGENVFESTCDLADPAPADDVAAVRSGYPSLTQVEPEI